MKIADKDCDHEVGDLIDWFDADDLGQYKSNGFWCVCAKCGGYGCCVKNEGNFWLSDDGEIL